MLLSPGHSPRHVSSPSPPPPNSSLDVGVLTITPVGSTGVISTADPPRKRRRSAVLDEDTYVEAIEKIIERDFFPDIPKLRDRLDWLEAIRSGDPIVIRDTQLKILERRAKAAALKTPSANPDATATAGHGRSQTPGSTFFAFPSATPLGSDKTPSLRPQDAAAAGEGEQDGPLVDTSLSLDEFFRKYTSEDNESFSKIIEKVNRRKKEKYAHLLERDGEDPSKALEVDKRERLTDGYGTSDQPLATLEGWKYTTKNLLMYNPTNSEVALTEEERVERLKGLTKEISRTNTRLHGKLVDSTPDTSSKEEATTTILYNAVPAATPAGASWPFPDREAEKLKKYDLEDLRKSPNPFYVESSKKAENGYSFVKTPSPAPDGSPFMTWGEIEGTPLRLDLEDFPVDGGSADGPRFSIPCPPTRDVKAHSLSRDAAKRLREKSKMFQKPPLPLPSPSRSGSASPSRVRTLSPAAQKFVRNAIAKSSHTGVDETLRASYRGATPPASTPRSTPKTSTRFGREASSLKSKSPPPSQGSSPW